MSDNQCTSEQVDGGNGGTVAQMPTAWGAAMAAGAFGGSIAGLIASYGTGRLGLAGFVVFMLTVMGVNGGAKKTLAAFLFAIVAALVVAVLKH